MTNVTPVEQQVEVEQTEEQSKAAGMSARFNRLKNMLRMAAIFSPILLFGLAILVSLGYWLTLNSLFGIISIGLLVAATILAIVAAFFVPKT